jgi:hypothetical protein
MGDYDRLGLWLVFSLRLDARTAGWLDSPWIPVGPLQKFRLTHYPNPGRGLRVGQPEPI